VLISYLNGPTRPVLVRGLMHDARYRVRPVTLTAAIAVLAPVHSVCDRAGRNQKPLAVIVIGGLFRHDPDADPTANLYERFGLPAKARWEVAETAS
jgi:hypothetical protein